MYQIYFILFSNDTVHFSDGLSVHHQEFKTVRTTTGICQTDTAVCLLASRHRYCLLFTSKHTALSTDTADCLPANRQQYLFDIRLLLYVQSWTPDDGRKDRPKHEECHSKIKYIWYIGPYSLFYYGDKTQWYLQFLSFIPCLFYIPVFIYLVIWVFFDLLC